MLGLEIQVAQGTLLGCTRTTTEGFNYNCYLGIPYAKPPVGNLRFKDPQPPDNWEGILNTKYYRAPNPQIEHFIGNGYVGDENSLFLNIYVPSSATKSSKLPVMFWIHGGGFHVGTGDDDVYGPDNLVQKNVILVTINYRLGPLGFLCLHTADVPGNAGLKDQVFGLRWVQRNISEFGGDPCNVTIFGQNAGAASVHYLMLSDMAKGLFKGCIMESGTCISEWAREQNPVKNAFGMAAKLGFDAENKEDLLDFLQYLPVNDLILSSSRLYSLTEKFMFSPVIEAKYDNVESFMSEDPIKVMKSGKFERVPCIIGSNNAEGFLFFYKRESKIIKLSTEEDSDNYLDCLILLYYSRFKYETKQKMLNEIKRIYFSDDKELIESIVELVTDFYFFKDVNTTIKALAEHKVPVYNYYFTHNGDLNMYRKLIKYPYQGASHGDEMAYLFQVNTLPAENVNTTDGNVRKQIVEMWTNFAKHGNPTPELAESITTLWKPFKNEEHNYLEIGNRMNLLNELLEERRKFWSEVANTKS